MSNILEESDPFIMIQFASRNGIALPEMKDTIMPLPLDRRYRMAILLEAVAVDVKNRDHILQKLLVWTGQKKVSNTAIINPAGTCRLVRIQKICKVEFLFKSNV